MRIYKKLICLIMAARLSQQIEKKNKDPVIESAEVSSSILLPTSIILFILVIALLLLYIHEKCKKIEEKFRIRKEEKKEESIEEEPIDTAPVLIFPRRRRGRFKTNPVHRKKMGGNLNSILESHRPLKSLRSLGGRRRTKRFSILMKEAMIEKKKEERRIEKEKGKGNEEVEKEEREVNIMVTPKRPRKWGRAVSLRKGKIKNRIDDEE